MVTKSTCEIRRRTGAKRPDDEQAASNVLCCRLVPKVRPHRLSSPCVKYRWVKAAGPNTRPCTPPFASNFQMNQAARMIQVTGQYSGPSSATRNARYGGGNSTGALELKYEIRTAIPGTRRPIHIKCALVIRSVTSLHLYTDSRITSLALHDVLAASAAFSHPAPLAFQGPPPQLGKSST